MMMLPANVRIFLCKEPIRIQKSFEGLSMLVESLFPGELFSGAFFVFLNRGRTHLKVLYWEKDGFVIWYKRLEKGLFTQRETYNLERRDFLMLLEGIEPKKIRQKFS